RPLFLHFLRTPASRLGGRCWWLSAAMNPCETLQSRCFSGSGQSPLLAWFSLDPLGKGNFGNLTVEDD
ncbi:hypothetical protein ACEOPW_19100, partial [Pseudomonas aeruginosa]